MSVYPGNSQISSLCHLKKILKYENNRKNEKIVKYVYDFKSLIHKEYVVRTC